jgi:16S rRNA (cytidine1402-2'-O)-methyltransferase
VRYNAITIVATLYVIATPIGNLEDITFRAVRLLGEVSLIAAEDTRTARQLLTRYNLKARITSYHEHNKKEKLDTILDHLRTGDVALISEAGMPGLSDPGYELIVAAINQQINVVPVPGPSAIVTAISVSGLPTDRFMYLGFLPRRSGERRRLLQEIADVSSSLICFESPHRICESLEDILKVLGDRKLAVCRELTKVHEEVFRGKVSDAIIYFQQPRGEFTLVLEGHHEGSSRDIDEKIMSDLYNLYRQGLGAKESVSMISETSGVSKRKLYECWLQMTKGEK